MAHLLNLLALFLHSYSFDKERFHSLPLFIWILLWICLVRTFCKMNYFRTSKCFQSVMNYPNYLVDFNTTDARVYSCLLHSNYFNLPKFVEFLNKFHCCDLCSSIELMFNIRLLRVHLCMKFYTSPNTHIQICRNLLRITCTTIELIVLTTVIK